MLGGVDVLQVNVNRCLLSVVLFLVTDREDFFFLHFSLLFSLAVSHCAGELPVFIPNCLSSTFTTIQLSYYFPQIQSLTVNNTGSRQLCIFYQEEKNMGAAAVMQSLQNAVLSAPRWALLGPMGYLLLVALLRHRRRHQIQKQFNYATRESLSRMTDDEAWQILMKLATLEFPFINLTAIQFALFRVSVIIYMSILPANNTREHSLEKRLHVCDRHTASRPSPNSSSRRPSSRTRKPP